MNLEKYFNETHGTGVLATADSACDMAIITIKTTADRDGRMIVNFI